MGDYNQRFHNIHYSPWSSKIIFFQYMVDVKLICTDEEISAQKKLLLKRIREEGLVSDPRVIKAFLKVPREDFVPPNRRCEAYIDAPIPIGYGQTISAPHMVLIMTDRLKVSPGMKVLEVGTGSGYQAAILSELISGENGGKEGMVITIERIKELAEFAYDNLKKTGYIKNVKIIVGDGSKGYPELAPYDRIIVTAAAPKVPRSLIEQLKPGGIMVIPVGDLYYQDLLIITKKEDGRLMKRKDVPCVFVPLIGEEGWSI